MQKEPLKPQNIRLPISTWAAIAAYRDQVGAVTIADAVRRLVLAGLRAEKKTAEKK